MISFKSNAIQYMNISFATLSEYLPRVYSPRIALRPVSMADGWPLFEATRNPIFNQHLTWPAPHTELESLKRIDLIEDAVIKGQLSAVSAVVKSTGEWIGLFRLLPYFRDGSRITDSMEAGIWVRDKFWQGQYALDLGLICMDAAFRYTDVQTIVAGAAPENRSSCALLVRGGLRQGQLATRKKETGGLLTVQEYLVTRAEWENNIRAKRLFNYIDQNYSNGNISASGIKQVTPENSNLAMV